MYINVVGVKCSRLLKLGDGVKCASQRIIRVGLAVIIKCKIECKVGSHLLFRKDSIEKDGWKRKLHNYAVRPFVLWEWRKREAVFPKGANFSPQFSKILVLFLYFFFFLSSIFHFFSRNLEFFHFLFASLCENLLEERKTRRKCRK